MAITAAQVKELREMTGAGMMDCKKALEATEGDMDKAVDFLREKGLASAAKKASRIAALGLVTTKICPCGKKAVVLEVNSETDFVAKNEKFRTYVGEVAEQALNSEATDMEGFMAEKWNLDESMTVKEKLSSMIAVIGENMNIRRFEQVSVEDGAVASYIHAGGNIGVLVAAEGSSDDAAKEALTNVAMQIAAMNPQYISRSEISDAELAKIREITVESALNDPASLPKPILMKLQAQAVESAWNEEDKAAFAEQKTNKFWFNFISKEGMEALAALAVASKADIVSDKIFGGLVDGRIAKQLKEICLMDQTYVKAEDGKQTVAQYLQQVAKAAGQDVTVVSFIRYETGEGLQKKEENFAEEVAKQMQG